MGVNGVAMKESDVRKQAFAMPLTNPAYPVGPYRFISREYLIITYRTDAAKLRGFVPEPLEIDEPLVKVEFIPLLNLDGTPTTVRRGSVWPSSIGWCRQSRKKRVSRRGADLVGQMRSNSGFDPIPG
jgi:acetoacetate decarboxylase